MNKPKHLKRQGYLYLTIGGTMDLEKLKEEQKRLARKIVLKDTFSDINTVGGCQLLYTSKEMIAVAVLLDYKTHELIDKKYAVSKPTLPFVPGFQGYREIPLIIEAISHLIQKPDLVIYPGEGIVHPRKFGPASHLGLAIDTPTIGVSKNISCGEIRDFSIFCGEEKRGEVLKTKEYAKPLHISPGNNITLSSSMKIISTLMKEGSKLPEPLRVAHNYGLFIKKNLSSEGKFSVSSQGTTDAAQA